MLKVFRAEYDGNEVNFTTSEATKILMHVYGWDQETILRKPAKSIEYWIKRALKNPSLEDIMFIDLVLNPVLMTRKKRGFFAGLFGK